MKPPGLFYSILPYFTQKLPPREQLLELKFKELLFNIFSNPANANLLAYVHSIQDQDKTPIREVMEANYMFNLTIADYARMAQRSVATKENFANIITRLPANGLLKNGWNMQNCC